MLQPRAELEVACPAVRAAHYWMRLDHTVAVLGELLTLTINIQAVRACSASHSSSSPRPAIYFSLKVSVILYPSCVGSVCASYTKLLPDSTTAHVVSYVSRNFI
jgi:hypothetical protein